MVGQIKSLKEIVSTKDLAELDSQLSHATLKLGVFGARKVFVQNEDVSKDLSLNSIIAAFEKIVCAEGASFDVDQAKRIYDKIKHLKSRNVKLMMHIKDNQFQIKSVPGNLFTRTISKIMRPFRKFPNLFFNRSSHLHKIADVVNPDYYRKNAEKNLEKFKNHFPKFGTHFPEGQFPNYYKGVMSREEAKSLAATQANTPNAGSPFLYQDKDHFDLLTLWDGEDNQSVVLTDWDNINLTMWLSNHVIQPTDEFLPKIRLGGEAVANDTRALKISKLPEELLS